MVVVGVTGGSGFLGAHVCAELVHHGLQPLVFDMTRPRGPEVEWIQGDVRDPSAVTDFVRRCDGVIHLAGVLGTQETIHEPRPAFETNVLGGLNVIEAAVRGSLPAVTLSTGNHFMANPYAISKSAIDSMATMYNLYRGGCVTIVRPLNAYGPGQLPPIPYGRSSVRKVVPSFVTRALSGHPIEVYFDGRQVSALVWVGDVAQAIVAALRSTQQSGVPISTTIEIGPSTSISIRETAELVIELCAARGYAPVPIVDAGRREGEDIARDVVADTSTLLGVGMSEADLTELRVGLERTIDWLIESRGDVWDVPHADA